MNNIMVDLETMGSGSHSAIIAIGAVEFDTTKKQLGKEFYRVIDLTSSVEAGGEMDPSTVIWWMGQSDEARKAFTAKGVKLPQALIEFVDFLDTCAPRKTRCIWGNGASFDNVILGNAFRRLQLTIPWEFWNDRCYRTIKALYPDVKIKREGTHHNALDDAKDQARHLFDIFE